MTFPEFNNNNNNNNMDEPQLIGDHSGSLPQRKKLQLKPRSSQTEGRARRRSSSARGDPFGNAKPREEVLLSRGIDPQKIDLKIEKKAKVLSFTPDQEIEVEAARAELTRVEALLRDANEQELPEEVFRVQVEKKRTELHEIMEKFAKMNVPTKKEENPWSSTTAKQQRRSPQGSGAGTSSFSATPMLRTGASNNRRNWNEAK